MEKSKNKPKLRFPGFTESWEQHKLGELSDVYDGTHQTPNYTDNGVMFLSVENIKTLQSEKYISEEAFEKEFKIFPEKGDILMTRIGDIGTANVVESNEPKAYYVSLALLKHKKLDPYFLKESISSETVKKELWHRTLHIAFPKKINKNEIANVSIPYPKSEEEQHQIGAFFKNLDNLVTLHQRKLNHLKDKKKSLLQKMFPKKGEDSPELRFPGFTDPWEQRKLNEKVDIIGTGKSKFISNIQETEGKPYAVLGSTSVISYDNEYDYSGDFVLTARVGANAGDLYQYSGNVKISDNTVFLQGKNLNFVFYLLTKFNLKNLSFGTGQPLIKASELSNLDLMFPCQVEENKQIGAFFKNLDNLITLHQRKLNHLQELKKALLQQMFV